MDPVQAELDYQRLVIEYPGGLYSAEALLRLAQAAHAQDARVRWVDHRREHVDTEHAERADTERATLQVGPSLQPLDQVGGQRPRHLRQLAQGGQIAPAEKALTARAA